MTYHRAFDRRRYLTSRNFYARAQNPAGAYEVGGEPSSEADYSPEIVLGRAGLQGAFRNLSHNQRETIRLFFFEGYTLREISEKLGQPLGNVRGHYYRGLDRLRNHMFCNNSHKKKDGAAMQSAEGKAEE
jgi:RNA polymerase sigma-70 factor (ECF subfamily)